jgi:GntR family transcriptional regulator, phosphonate transport system regulatory protein
MRDAFLTSSDERPPLAPLRESGRAMWRQIEDTLVAEIARGVYPAESQLPTEKELAERFDVNRHTVRRALAALTQRGLLLVEQGRGSFVVRDAIDYALGPHTRFSENLLRAGKEPAHELLRASEVPSNENVARNLKIRPGTRVILLETIGRANKRPITLGKHFYPARLVPDMIVQFERWRSITKALQHSGIGEYSRAWTRITARLPQQSEAHLLRLSTTAPVLVTESVNVESRGRPVEYGETCFASDRVQLVVDLTRQS